MKLLKIGLLSLTTLFANSAIHNNIPVKDSHSIVAETSHDAYSEKPFYSVMFRYKPKTAEIIFDSARKFKDNMPYRQGSGDLKITFYNDKNKPVKSLSFESPVNYIQHEGVSSEMIENGVPFKVYIPEDCYNLQAVMNGKFLNQNPVQFKLSDLEKSDKLPQATISVASLDMK